MAREKKQEVEVEIEHEPIEQVYEAIENAQTLVKLTKSALDYARQLREASQVIEISPAIVRNADEAAYHYLYLVEKALAGNQ